MNLIWKDLWRPSSWMEPGERWQSCRRSWPCSRTAYSPSPPCRPWRAAGPSWRSQSQSWNRDHHAETTLIKKTIKFSIYKEIQSGAVAKSYMTNGLLIQYMVEIFAHFLIYCIRKLFLIYDSLLYSEFPHIWGEFSFIFYQCMVPIKAHFWPRFPTFLVPTENLACSWRQQLYPI